MKLFPLVFMLGLVVPLCTGSAESQIDPNRVLRGTYLKFFLYANDFEKRDFLEAEKTIGELDPDAPFPELINCLREYIEGDYPRALFLLSKAEEKRSMRLEDNGSAFRSFLIAAPFLWKIQILSKIGRREEACEEETVSSKLFSSWDTKGRLHIKTRHRPPGRFRTSA